MTILLALAVGFAFGFLLHRARVTDSNVIEGQFCLRDFTMVKMLLPAIVVGGLGVLVLARFGETLYYIKDANVLAVILGGAIFGLAVAILGYCPGTALAATATGSLHALSAVFGMIAGAIAYAFSFNWIKAHILNVWALGKVRLPQLTGVPDLVWLLGLAAASLAFFFWLERRSA
ncbi:YeeE/YedE thiosulfate transporter family protein [Rhodoblastus sp.]|uniref:YeeE/YedE thiosulfate transporter family protein n=1 Tax=Rhodoblastus sp. TaxID=1962975 RepID=UPI0026136BD4|nr:YeeE/YedE thiosulfate transporter family protein [Rhodoblastus sp.]